MYMYVDFINLCLDFFYKTYRYMLKPKKLKLFKLNNAK